MGHRTIKREGLVINVRLPKPETHYKLMVVGPPPPGKSSPQKQYIDVPVGVLHDKLGVKDLVGIKAMLKFNISVVDKMGESTKYIITPHVSSRSPAPEEDTSEMAEMLSQSSV